MRDDLFQCAVLSAGESTGNFDRLGVANRFLSEVGDRREKTRRRNSAAFVSNNEMRNPTWVQLWFHSYGLEGGISFLTQIGFGRQPGLPKEKVAGVTIR